MRIHLVLAGSLVLALGAAGAQSATPAQVSGLDARQAVALANQWGAAGVPVQSVVTTEAVSFTWPDGRRAEVPMLKDAVYIAIAPYVNRTHPCINHVPSSCQAEMAGETFQVSVLDAKGATVFAGPVKALANGFIELWIPRGLGLLVQVDHRSGRATRLLSTQAGAPTCITDMQLR